METGAGLRRLSRSGAEYFCHFGRGPTDPAILDNMLAPMRARCNGGIPNRATQCHEQHTIDKPACGRAEQGIGPESSGQRLIARLAGQARAIDAGRAYRRQVLQLLYLNRLAY